MCIRDSLEISLQNWIIKKINATTVIMDIKVIKSAPRGHPKINISNIDKATNIPNKIA